MIGMHVENKINKQINKYKMFYIGIGIHCYLYGLFGFVAVLDLHSTLNIYHYLPCQEVQGVLFDGQPCPKTGSQMETRFECWHCVCRGG
jgi:hypothetical protein